MNRHRISLLSGALALALTLSACASPSGGGAPSGGKADDATAAYQTVTAEEAKKLLDENPDIVLVDVRRPDEYEESHIPGAINIPNEEIDKQQPDVLADLDAPLVIYCRTGVRSKQASDKLVDIGYTSVTDMGGIVDWPYETVSGGEPGTYPRPEKNDAADPGENAATGIMSKFSATDLEGNPVDQSIFADYDLTMINVWATFCSPCINEMPELGELAAEYADKRVRIVGLVSDTLNSKGELDEGQIETAKEIVAKTKADYLHVLPSEDLFGILSQISSVPTTFFVNSKGEQVGSAVLGSNTKKKWTQIIDQTLSEVSA
ncbi:MAG: rhodanese-like domain-containing protein [Eubacteriales bacterium]|nr:rhodanese-like domain-containing protein [Eubacteriales bacterium]